MFSTETASPARTAQTGKLPPCGFDAGDGNLRRYVGNDPTNATDPSGLAAQAPPLTPPLVRDDGGNLVADYNAAIDLLRRPFIGLGSYFGSAWFTFGDMELGLKKRPPGVDDATLDKYRRWASNMQHLMFKIQLQMQYLKIPMPGQITSSSPPPGFDGGDTNLRPVCDPAAQPPSPTPPAMFAQGGNLIDDYNSGIDFLRRRFVGLEGYFLRAWLTFGNWRLGLEKRPGGLDDATLDKYERWLSQMENLLFELEIHIGDLKIRIPEPVPPSAPSLDIEARPGP